MSSATPSLRFVPAGYRLGKNGVICGRITSLNHRVDIPEVLDWINADAQFQD